MKGRCAEDVLVEVYRISAGMGTSYLTHKGSPGINAFHPRSAPCPF
jgi:hypothetical protein